VEYYEDQGAAFIDFQLTPIAGVPQPVNPVQPPSSPTGPWLAYYYNNPNLAGDPVAILTVDTPNANWGTGSPLASVTSDNFSIRYTSTQTYSAGNYRITTRADDGVRVYVNGFLVINQWRGSAGQENYTADVALRSGQNSFTIEYYEATGDALLDVNINRVTTTAPTPQTPVDTGATATVTTNRLNVRDIPSTSNSDVLTQITRDETFNVIGRTPDSAWWQINVDGTVGWVFGNFVDVTNAGSVPVTAGRPGNFDDVAPTGFSVTAATNVNIRSGPSTGNAVLGRFPAGRSAQVVGRNASATWWQINYSGVVGWVSSAFARIEPGADLGQIPVRG
jgi:uncharacterized protein YraI